MKRFVCVLLAGLLAAGCAGPREKRAKVQPKPPSDSAKTGDDKARNTPQVSEIGKVIQLYPSGHFVMLSFPIGTVPPIGQHMVIYRQGQKVGEVRVSAPQDEISTAADIMSGDAQVGDEVRGS